MNIREMMRNKKAVAIAIGAVVMLILIFNALRGDNGDAGYDEVAVSRGNIQPTITSTGTVSPENRLEIKPPINGRVDEILVKEGAEVKKGQMLLKMSSTERAAVLDAARAQGDSELRRWETYYSPAPILAPIDGTIIVKSAEAGQTVTSQDVLLVMSDRLTVKAQVDETDIRNIKLGQKADIILDAYPNDTIPGTVDRIAFDSKTVNNITTYIVDVLPGELPAAMRSGMTASVNFYLDSKNDVLSLPANALHMKDGKNYVLMRRGKTEKPVERYVETGISDGNKVEVTKGLKEGEVVLVERIKWAKDSDKSNPLLPSRPKGPKKPKGI